MSGGEGVGEGGTTDAVGQPRDGDAGGRAGHGVGAQSSAAVADRYLERRSAVDPDAAAALGRRVDCAVPDLSPDGFAARYEVEAGALADLGPVAADVLGAALRERLLAEVALYDCGFTTSLLAPLATPVHRLREIFDDLPRDSDEDWQRIATHLEAAASGFSDYATTLRDSAQRGNRFAARQVRVVADQCASWIDPAGTDFYRRLAGSYQGRPELAGRLLLAADEVSRSAGEFVTFLRTDLAPLAAAPDAVGEQLYRTTSRAFLGAAVDPAELYEYGWDELRRLTGLATGLGRRLTGERDLGAAREALDRRPGARIGVGELVGWLQSRLDALIAELGDAHFDIPSATAAVEARLVTAGSGVMYYSPADPALTRPGRVWWSVPPGTDSVATWREASTVHHEGLPGHHLQFAVTTGIADLHPWQRYLCHVHGYAEGWAHYAEQLAVDLGLLHGDDELLGVYGAQLWRAARIVIDIGLHLGYPVQAGTGLTDETAWEPDMAARFLSDVAGVDPATAAWEVDRYLGWPGQALAFKVGARLWDAARADRQRALGAAFTLKGFHMTALRLGPMGLDPLRAALAGTGV